MSLFSIFKNKCSTANNQEPIKLNYILVTVRPGINPDERESKYGDPLNSILKESNVGEVTGGGTMLNKPDANGNKSLEFSDVEIQMNSRGKEGLQILLDGLKKFNFPENTEIQVWDSDLNFSSISSFSDYLNK